jgi:hypothetical protein
MKQAALRPESYTKKVALVLQGGGALGSYKRAFTRRSPRRTTNLTGWPASRSARSMRWHVKPSSNHWRVTRQIGNRICKLCKGGFWKRMRLCPHASRRY